MSLILSTHFRCDQIDIPYNLDANVSAPDEDIFVPSVTKMSSVMKHTMSHTTTLFRTGGFVLLFCLTGFWASTECLAFIELLGAISHDLYASVGQALHFRVI